MIKQLLLSVLRSVFMCINTLRVSSRFNQINDGDKKILVIITPWRLSPVPYFTMIIAKLLQAKGGRVEVFLSKYGYPDSKINSRVEFFFIRICLRILKLNIANYKKLDSVEINSGQLNNINDVAKNTAIWLKRGEQNVNIKDIDEVADQISKFYVEFKSLAFDVNSYDKVFYGGGVTGPTGIILKSLLTDHAKVSTFDSAPGKCIITSVNGAACKLHDLPIVFNKYKILLEDEGVKQRLIDLASDEIESRFNGNDRFCYQNSKHKYEGDEIDILFPLNSSWDASALGTHKIFSSSSDWLLSSIKYVVENHNVAKIVVRQHPAERYSWQKSSDNIEKLLSEYINSNKVVFVKADDDISSYDLLKKTSLVVYGNSTIGLESLIQNIPVLSAANSYHNVMTGHYISSKEEYFTKLDFLLNNIKVKKTVDKQSVAEASLLYVLGQKCNWVDTLYGLSNWRAWPKLGGKLSNEDNIYSFVDSILTGVPFCDKQLSKIVGKAND
ncbi:hypothetical protein [Litoribacillus peritrichatus]|uniref:Capsule polysaccharide biosynthesis protein n=1 Tax=Litoribacillus peritrichatus TaxID=718191 RepID=A0ABP7M201_9GAMM